MAGHVDHFVPRRDLLQRVEVVDLHAVVDLVPEPGQQERDRTHHRVRVVGRDLPGVAARAAGRLLDADAFLAGHGRDRLAHALAVEHRVDHRAPVREVGTDHRGAQAAEVRAHHARGLAHRALGIEPLGRDLAQAHRRAEVHDGVAPVEQDREQAAEAAHHHPVLGEQHAEPAAAAAGRAADEDRHRHDLDVEFGVVAQRGQQFRQALGMAIALGFGEEPGLAVLERQHRARAAQPVAAHGLERRRQAGLAGGLLEDQRIGEPVALQQVAHRRLAGAQHRAGIGRIGADAQPRTQQPRHEPERPGGAGGVGGDYAGGSDGHDGVRRRVAARARARAVGFGRGVGLSRRQRPPTARRTWPVPRSSACRTSARRPRPVRPRRTAASPAGCSGSAPWPGCPRAR